jgi:hypothetical protein
MSPESGTDPIHSRAGLTLLILGMVALHDPFSLSAATIASYPQIRGAVFGLLTAAETLSSEKGTSQEELIEARLAVDMHSADTPVRNPGSICAGILRGEVRPPVTVAVL